MDLPPCALEAGVDASPVPGLPEGTGPREPSVPVRSYALPAFLFVGRASGTSSLHRLRGQVRCLRVSSSLHRAFSDCSTLHLSPSPSSEPPVHQVPVAAKGRHGAPRRSKGTAEGEEVAGGEEEVAEATRKRGNGEDDEEGGGSEGRRRGRGRRGDGALAAAPAERPPLEEAGVGAADEPAADTTRCSTCGSLQFLPLNKSARKARVSRELARHDQLLPRGVGGARVHLAQVLLELPDAPPRPPRAPLRSPRATPRKGS